MITEEKLKQIQKVRQEELLMEHERQLEEYRKRPKNVDPDSMWLVVYECQYEVVRISALGDGFFAPGQEPCWSFDNISEWVREIKPPNETLTNKIDEPGRSKNPHKCTFDEDGGPCRICGKTLVDILSD